ncbi:MAG: thiamine-phosphate kinase [Nitrososphaerales archaeon]
MTNSLNEEEIIQLIWKKIGTSKKIDPFADDASWIVNNSKKFVVAKSDMLVAATDAPKQMTASQMAKKAVVSCVSDFAAKGVRPSFCIISLGLPGKKATRRYLRSMASGFASAQKEYGLEIIGGDTNATSADTVIDCTMFGFTDRMVKRNSASPGDLVGVSGTFGHQAAGLLLLLGKAISKGGLFEQNAVDSVLNPRAKLDLGLKTSRFLSSATDSSDGLAISLFHLAESSKVDFVLDEIPTTLGVENFASVNQLRPHDLALFGGEEFELVCTFNSQYERVLSRMGIKAIGRVLSKPPTRKSSIVYKSMEIQRRGWVNFR